MFKKGNTIGLRALEPSDASILYDWENDPAIWPVSFTQIPFSKFILEEFVNSAHQDIYTNKQLRLIVVSLKTNQAIGIIDLYEFDPQHLRCGLGIYINQDYRGNGSAFECIELIKEYGFMTLHLKQFYVLVNTSNIASIGLFEKAGFEKSGLKKSWNKTGLSTFEDVWFLQCIQNVD